MKLTIACSIPNLVKMMFSIGAQKVLTMTANVNLWTRTGVLTRDCQCGPMDTQGYRPVTANVDPWTPTVVLTCDCQCGPMDTHSGTDPLLSMLSLIHI